MKFIFTHVSNVICFYLQKFEYICKYLLASMNTDVTKVQSYVVCLYLSASYLLITRVKQIVKCISFLNIYLPEQHISHEMCVLNFHRAISDVVIFAFNFQNMYVSVALLKDHVLHWIQQIKTILWQCCK